MRLDGIECYINKTGIFVWKPEPPEPENMGKDGSIETEIDFSSPETVAKSFWNALKNEQVELAKRHYITPEEGKPLMGEKIVERLSREFRQLENNLIQKASNSKWIGFKIREKEYFKGKKFLEAYVEFEKGGVSKQIGLALISIGQNTWKITDVD